ncbi:MAG: metallophosphoesterase [Pseudomonadales bacterium]
MIRLVHITDPHLTTLDGQRLWRLRGKRWSGYLSWQRRRRHVHLRERLDRVTAAALAEDPVQILVTGDLVHIGLPGEIEAAAGWLEALGPPQRVMLVPGNHDDYAADSRAALQASWAAYLPESDADYPRLRTLEDGGVTISLLGLSSVMPTPLFMAHGRLGPAQLGRFDRALAAADGFRCVLLHHPPLPGMASWRKGLHDASALADVLDGRGAELVLHGHVHRNVSARSPAGVPVYGTASASSNEPPASYRRIDIGRDGDDWVVDQRLIEVAADGGRAEAERVVWRTPVRESATAPSAA